MLIAVIGDTHIRSHTKKLDLLLSNELSNVDLIIHTGDYTSGEVFDKIGSSKKLIGVYGNNDKGRLRSSLKQKELITLEGIRIGICHGDGPKKETIENAADAFKNDKTDIVIYGHSHKPSIMTRHKTIYLNPGSLTNKRREAYYSYVLLDIKDRKVNSITFKFI